MNRKEFEVYLGDVVCSSGKNDRNIENKVNQGVGAVSQIVSMLNSISLGHFYHEIALILRDSMLVSKLLSSSEIWYNVATQEYRKLETIDEMYFRRIFNVPISTPKESFYIETGQFG